MTDPAYEAWAAEERQRSEDLNRRHEARLAEQNRPSDDDLSPQERAERDAHLVKSSDDMMREAAGKPHPPEGHDVREWHPELFETDTEGPDPIDREALKAEIKAELLAELRGE